ncbi:hypothetical protein [Methylobacterium sp. 1973]|uniref:hypothetical protein n=1 Tax=Methylobacterium sp. 1973 TaxID=3156421 RepID=UPI003393658C
MPGRLRRRHTTFLVSVTVQGSSPASGATVYAVMKPSAAEALEAVRPLVDPSATLAIVGSLSTRIAKALKLKRDEPRVV